jgi:hypothetical protein
MRYKVVPSPADADRLEAAHGALPLVPGSVEDCCTRIRDRTGVDSRDAAREWLTFVQALGLAAETDRGYHRVRGTPDRASLADAYLDGVFPAREVHEALAAAGTPLPAGEVFERVRGAVPRWERSRHSDWEAEWRDRVELALEWAVVFGLADRETGRYAVQ